MTIPRRLAIVTSHPIQYQAPWFRALAKEIDLEVLFAHRQDPDGQAAAGFGHAFEWDVPLLDGYKYRWLTNVSATPGVDTYAGCDTPGIRGVLKEGGFDACLINGWYLKSYGQAIRACRGLGIPILMRGDSQLGTRRHWAWAAAKYLPYRWMLSRIDAHLYVGQSNRQYLEHYGVDERRLFPVLHFVDNDRFRLAAEAAREDGRARRHRESAGAGEHDVLFVFVGKLIEKKRPFDFVHALEHGSAPSAPRRRGLIVGSGPLEAGLREYVRDRRVPCGFAGFQNQRAIAEYYAASDCLVLPSDGRETWGLVANEAMACGLPIIVSDAVGCAADLATDGVAGNVFRMGDIAALAAAMQGMADRVASGRDELRRAVSIRISKYSKEAAVAGTLSAVAAVTDSQRRRVAS